MLDPQISKKLIWDWICIIETAFLAVTPKRLTQLGPFQKFITFFYTQEPKTFQQAKVIVLTG